MGLSLKPQYLKRYKNIAKLLIKYGRADLISSAGLEEVVLNEDKKQEVTEEIDRLPNDLEELGPAYVKLGQFFSTRSDMLPAQYVEVLQRLQDKVKPFDFKIIKEIVEDEIGMRFSKAFLEFDEEPLGSASIGQVHRAVLKNGKPVVVKVQRPDIREEIAADIDAFKEIAGFLNEHTDFGKRFMLAGTIEEFKKTVLRELDYRNEIQNLKVLANNLKEFKNIVVPLSVEDYSSSKVLTMDIIRGKKITSVSPLRKLELNGKALAETVFQAYMKQIMIDGFYHSDPHPGNVFITDDNKIALLDLGMVGYVSNEMQNNLLHILLAIGDGRGDEVADYAMKVGNPDEDVNKQEFKSKISELVAQQKSTSLENLEMGRIILEVTKVCGENGMVLPNEFAMLGKTLLNLDKVGKILDPDFNPNSSIRRNADDLMRKKLFKSATSKKSYDVLLDSKEFIEKLPSRVNNILDKVSNNELELKVKSIDEVYLMNGLQKIANRIAIGLILAALIIGASNLMNVETDFTLFGYPGVAMIFFLIAIAGSITLAMKIMFSDEHTSKKKQRKLSEN
ncbi:MAG TPA: AarF/UbiB family protein [Ignavibacteria bacterium]|nr:AarF/UbiB family protein [Ignavibacteria bacterium]